MSGEEITPLTAEDEPDPWKRMERATTELRRREYRETTMGERIEQAFELNDLANEIQAGMPSEDD